MLLSLLKKGINMIINQLNQSLEVAETSIFNFAGKIPVLSSFTGSARIIMGVAQVALGGISLLTHYTLGGCFFDDDHLITALEQSSNHHFHGWANIFRGMIEAIPLVNLITISFDIGENGDSKRFSYHRGNNPDIIDRIETRVRGIERNMVHSMDRFQTFLNDFEKDILNLCDMSLLGFIFTGPVRLVMGSLQVSLGLAFGIIGTLLCLKKTRYYGFHQFTHGVLNIFRSIISLTTNILLLRHFDLNVGHRLTDFTQLRNHVNYSGRFNYKPYSSPSTFHDLQKVLTRLEKNVLNELGHIPILSTITGSLRALMGLGQVSIGLLGMITGIVTGKDSRFYGLQQLLHGIANISRSIVEIIPFFNLLLIDYDSRENSRFEYLERPAEPARITPPGGAAVGGALAREAARREAIPAHGFVFREEAAMERGELSAEGEAINDGAVEYV